MSRALYYLGFAVPALAVFYAMHRYAWARLVRDARLPRPWRTVSTYAVVVLAVLLVAVFALARITTSDWARAGAAVAYTWLGVLFYLTLLLAALDLARFLWRRTRRASEPVDEGRRLFLARAVSSAAAVGAGALAVGGRRSAFEITKPEVAVRLPRLPPALSGFRIAHLSDLHLGPILQQGFLETVVDETNASRPDLVVITGDLIDAPVARLGRSLAPLGRLRARHGVAFVTGNHEYYFGAAQWIEFLRRQGLSVLVNERIAVGDSGAGGASFDLAGVPDHDGGRFLANHEPDLDRALAGHDEKRALALLAHQPRQIALAKGRGVGLQLSGHTHGGQLWPFGALVSISQPWISGLHRSEEGPWVYVSRGTGFWGPPMRVGAPAEIATIVLTA